MSAIYDNWERLVAAVLKKQQLWELFHAQSRSPSILSEASDFSSFRSDDLAFQGSSKSSNLVLISDFNPAFNVKDVYLESADLLGMGTFGSSYAAGMNTGVTILVKRLNSSNISVDDFKRHMDVVGSVRHENVVSLRAYFYSGNERLLLYDYYSNGSVFALLHGITGGRRDDVDWHTRLKIAVGAARGIAKIHAYNRQKLAHGNLKSSNVFMNAEKYGCVSDFGITKVMETSFMPNAQCYAPEIKNRPKNVSQKSDVYSFGILLLELLTRKSPVGVTGGPEPVDLVKLVSGVSVRLRISSVYDADLLKYPAIREQMVKVLQIGISCTAKSLRRRPKMSDVVGMLEDLIISNPTNSSSLRTNLIFFDNSSPMFDLEDLLRASAEVLGKGSFGTSYKARLENGEVFMVKRLRDVDAGQSDFDQHMMVIGACRHKNVTKLRTYYYSRDEKMLVYDYIVESVSNMLHGKVAKSERSLDWETRLKIAVGAARGLPYIHRQNNGNLVHGNVKSSNIFLNTRQYGLISDTGVAKVVSPFRRLVLRNSGYFAPEVKDTRNISQSSEVYSFGVVLLELISRSPSVSISNDGETTLLVNSIRSSIRGNKTAEVLDKDLRSQNEESMIELLVLALDCVNDVSEQRPGMPEVVRRLEEIVGIDSEEELYTESGLDYNIGSGLEDVLENLLPVLTLKMCRAYLSTVFTIFWFLSMFVLEICEVFLFLLHVLELPVLLECVAKVDDALNKNKTTTLHQDGCYDRKERKVPPVAGIPISIDFSSFTRLLNGDPRMRELAKQVSRTSRQIVGYHRLIKKSFRVLQLMMFLVLTDFDLLEIIFLYS